VYLSRELAKLGYEVTVYNERDEEYVDTFTNGRVDDGKNNIFDTVTYKPWTEVNQFDKFNIFVAWRAPELAKNVNARLKVVDVHDALEEKRIIVASEYIDLFLVKSRYHKSLYPSVNKIKVISNGIKESYEDTSN